MPISGNRLILSVSVNVSFKFRIIFHFSKVLPERAVAFLSIFKYGLMVRQITAHDLNAFLFTAFCSAEGLP